MLAKQITSKLKQDYDGQQSAQQQSNLAVAQCDRLIRTVSCKHDTNPTIKKTNINVLQPFHETKLYISPHFLNNQQQSNNSNFETTTSSDHQPHTIIDATFSTKLKRRNDSATRNENNTSNPNNTTINNTMSETGEVNVKDLLDQIVENLTNLNISQWFAFGASLNNSTAISSATKKDSFLNSETLNDGSNLNESFTQTVDLQPINMFDSIQQALNHIDFNLKRNSDFINELTKLLDTSRALKLETQLKKMSKLLDDEKHSVHLNGVQTPKSQPGSPSMRSSGSGANNEDDDSKKKAKGKSFKLSTLSLSSKNDAKHAHDKSSLAPPGNSSKEISDSLLNIEANFRQHLQVKSHEITNSDYIELEKEVEKISYELDSLFRVWTRICNLANSQQAAGDQLKNLIEFQILINNLNSPAIVKDLEQSLFKINWLITSKSGFNEPNWQSCVLSLTPSTNDSFIGVNLLKNYYKYVKYDFVSYKLFTRQLQLIQLCAIILNSIHRILLFYRETITLSSITNNVNGPSGSANDMFGSSLLSFNFSSDKYRPISWSANHVTLYNVQNSKAAVTSSGIVTSSDNSKTNKGANVSRTPSARRDDARAAPTLSKEDQIKQIKSDVFVKELNDFLQLTTNRLNIQAHMANRTGYFYIVNQSTGLVLQAVDFTSECSLKEQIEQNQKRLQNTSIKSGTSGKLNSSSNMISKGPRFYLMNRITPNGSNSPSANKTTDSTLTNTDTRTDEQLWYYYLINGCVANKIIRSGYCMAASSLNAKSPVCFWPNVKTTNCSWFFNSLDQTIVSGLNDDLVLDYVVIDEPPNQRYAVVIDTKVPNKVSQKWSFEFC